jgi:hypothetical protein
MPNLDLEIKVIERWVSKDKQERFIGFVADSAKRKKFTDELAHFKHLKSDKFEHIRKTNIIELQKKI